MASLANFHLQGSLPDSHVSRLLAADSDLMMVAAYYGTQEIPDHRTKHWVDEIAHTGSGQADIRCGQSWRKHGRPFSSTQTPTKRTGLPRR